MTPCTENTAHTTYHLVNFYAVERFPDPSKNTAPHVKQSPEANGHNLYSMTKIDPSCTSVKRTLDLLADHGGEYRKEHSTVRGVHAIYQANGTLRGFAFAELPISIELPFDQYMARGRPEEITFNVELLPKPQA